VVAACQPHVIELNEYCFCFFIDGGDTNILVLLLVWASYCKILLSLMVQWVDRSRAEVYASRSVRLFSDILLDRLQLNKLVNACVVMLTVIIVVNFPLFRSQKVFSENIVLRIVTVQHLTSLSVYQWRWDIEISQSLIVTAWAEFGFSSSWGGGLALSLAPDKLRPWYCDGEISIKINCIRRPLDLKRLYNIVSCRLAINTGWQKTNRQKFVALSSLVEGLN